MEHYQGDVYIGGKQYFSKDSLWEVIKTSCGKVRPPEIAKLTLSMDDRFLTVVKKEGWLYSSLDFHDDNFLLLFIY